MEQKTPYRKISLERIQSPEELNQYLHVTNPSVWVLLTAVILLLAGLLIWASFTQIDSLAYGRAEVRQGTMTVHFDDENAAKQVEVGMQISVGEVRAEIHSLGRDEQGIFALAFTDLADGEYQAKVLYKQTQILRLLFN